jgi:hypothetical protein
MSDKGTIVAGLVVFLALATLPIWYNLATGEKDFPDLHYPHEGGQCVEDTAYIRTNHMRLLTGWRDDAVRYADRIYTARDGRRHEKSLTGTCLSCHVEKEEFCDRCHDYIAAEIHCWDCHDQKKPMTASTAISVSWSPTPQ